MEETLGEYATREVAERAIRDLSTEERKKLLVIAAFWWKRFALNRTADIEPEDLLQEVIYRTIRQENPRRWRISKVSILKHLDRSMESIASHHRDRLAAEYRAAEASLPADGDGVDLVAASSTSNQEFERDTREELEQIQAYFEDDAQGLQAVRFRALGMSASEIQRELGIDDAREWEALRKRIQRKLAKYQKQNEEEA